MFFSPMKAMLLSMPLLLTTAAIPLQTNQDLETLAPRAVTIPVINWRFQASGHVIINDDESIGGDERWEGDFTWPAFTIGPSANRAFAWSKGMGGEVRVELALTAFTPAACANALPSLSYNIKLFEGTDENTGDLDGEASGSVTIDQTGRATFDVTVRNTQENIPDDFTRITLSLQATPVVAW